MKHMILIFVVCLMTTQVNAGIRFKKESFFLKNDHQKLNVYLPKDFKLEKKYPLFINLHGYGGQAFLQNILFPLPLLSTKKQFIAVSPEGLKDSEGKRYWNAKDCCIHKAKVNERRDDVAFLRSLIRKVQEKYPILSSQIYVVGHSNGGFMANRMACEASDIIAGIVNYAGAAFKNVVDCRPLRPVKVLHLHGTNDQTISYSGSDWHIGAKASTKQWVSHNNCLGPIKKHLLQKKGLFKKIITSQVWEGCDGRASVALWTIEKGKHRDFLPRSLTKKIVDYFLPN